MLPLSILDLSPVTAATPPAQALRNTLDLARFADTLGYTRYWLAEHHNLANIASSAPDIMIGQVAAVTKNMRVGSGGVMLPNHAPLMVMERFKVLEALFPGRIDLGLGRAPGTDQITSLALRRRQDTSGEQDDFLDRFQEMLLFESRGFPENHPFAKVAAPEEAAAYDYTPVDRQRMTRNRNRLIADSPVHVRERIEALVESTRADEVMITTMVFEHAARKRSYELLAREFQLKTGASQH